MNVFVLGTGRTGTTTLIRACSHLTNYTAGHETRVHLVGETRFDYPSAHIEADNRLSWFLGSLGRRFDHRPTLYVHLLRDEDEVIASYRSRATNRNGIIPAFSNGIIIQRRQHEPHEIDEVSRMLVRTVTDNVREFLRNRPSMELHLESLSDSFGDFVDRIGAEGDLRRAGLELRKRHNATVS
jgi:hypothetical protein